MPLYQYKCGECKGVIGEFGKAATALQPVNAPCRNPPSDDPDKKCEYKRVISPVRTTFKFADRRSMK